MPIAMCTRHRDKWWVSSGNALSVLPLFLWIGCTILSGCRDNTDLQKAQTQAKLSQEYYHKAEKEYQSLVRQGSGLDRAHFELGMLYFNHGEFIKARKEFDSSRLPQAKKFLAIASYRLSDFAGAAEQFSKNPPQDDEARYYQSLVMEKLNLFDQALAIYRTIKDEPFNIQALERINSIEKQASPLKIQEIDRDIYDLIKNSPSEEAYPQAGALILLADEKIEVTEDNRQVSSMHYLIKILNERGKGNFSESRIEYDSTYEKVEIVYARTVKPDGTVVDVGSRHIRDVSKYLNFPLYSNARVRIISFPEISEGVFLEYKLKITRNELINKKEFVFSYPLQNYDPVISANFKLVLPRKKPLHLKYINERFNDFSAKPDPKIQESPTQISYSWEFRDIPQIIPEPNMPPDAEINPSLLFSTFANWQEIYAWWWGLAKDKITADTAIKNKVAELIRDKKSDEEKIRAIYNFCAKDIRYVAVEYGQAGYEPHFAADIFKNKYGDCKDQAILLVTMLREAAINDSWPVLIPTRDCYNLRDDFPGMLFNHCIAIVALGEKMIFMDPTAETCSFGDLPVDDQARRVLICKDDAYLIQNTPLYPAEHNFIQHKLDIALSQNGGITARKNVSTSGVYDQAQRHWLLYTPPELIKESLNEKIQDISVGSQLMTYDIRNLDDLNLPVQLNYDFQGQEYFISAGRLRIMPQMTSIDASLVARQKRKYPLNFNFLDARETIFEVAIPKDFGVKYMPERISHDTPWIRFNAEYNVRDGRIYFKQKVELKKNVVEIEEYRDFKAFFEGLAKRIKERVVLEGK